MIKEKKYFLFTLKLFLFLSYLLLNKINIITNIKLFTLFIKSKNEFLENKRYFNFVIYKLKTLKKKKI